MAERTEEGLAVAGHGAGFVLHGFFALWHWLRSRHFDFFALFNAALSILCFVSIFVHLKRIGKDHQ